MKPYIYLLAILFFVFVARQILFNHKYSVIEKQIMLSWFKNVNNYVGYVTGSKSDIRNVHTNVFWKIDGNEGKVDISGPIVYIYCDHNNKLIYISTTNGIYYYDIDLRALKRITLPNDYVFYRCIRSSNSNKLLILGSKTVNGSVTFAFICLELTNYHYEVFMMPEAIRGVVDVAEDRFYALGVVRLYEISQGRMTPDTLHESITSFLGTWGEGKIISYFDENEKTTIQWNNVKIECDTTITECVNSAENLWVLDTQGNLRAYDISGELLSQIQLSKKPMKIGLAGDNSTWVFYRDNSVDVYHQNGKMLFTCSICPEYVL